MNKRIIRLLDLDLDFFQVGKFDTASPPKRRPDSRLYPPWGSEKVIRFLEDQCGLNAQKKVPGRFFVNHHELFYYLRELQKGNQDNLLFSIDHVDAHSDTGFMDSSYAYIWSDLLFRSPLDRQEPKKGGSGLTDANFLSFALACQWIHRLRYINNLDRANDINPQIFQDVDVSTNFLQLRKYPADAIEKFLASSFYEKVRDTPPLSLEPAVPFAFLDAEKFKNEEPYDIVCLTQSPGYSCKESDALIPIIRAYIDDETKTDPMGRAVT